MLGAGAVLGAAALSTTIAGTAEAASNTAPAYRPDQPVPEEKKSLNELYADALHEGGELIIYAGGDTPDQQDATKHAFLAQFPDIKLTMVVDYSKYHDVRVDNQLGTHTLVPDLVVLQTLQDFDRWKAMRVLLPYKPTGFSKVYHAFKDPDGAWIATGVAPLCRTGLMTRSGYLLDLVGFFEFGGAAVAEGAVQPGAVERALARARRGVHPVPGTTPPAAAPPAAPFVPDGAAVDVAALREALLARLDASGLVRAQRHRVKTGPRRVTPAAPTQHRMSTEDPQCHPVLFASTGSSSVRAMRARCSRA